MALLALDLLSRIVAMRVNPRPPYMGRLKSSANFMVLPFFVPFVLAIGGDRPTPIDPHESGGGGRSLDLRTTQRHEAEPAFKLTMVVKNRPPHPYIRWIRWIRTMMQLCASRARLRSSSSPFFFPVQRPWGDGGLPLPRIAFGRFVAMRAEVPKPGISSSFLSPITPLNAA